VALPQQPTPTRSGTQIHISGWLGAALKRLLISGIVAVGLGAVGSTQAFASPGCSALNAGAWNRSVTDGSVTLPTETFSAGDKITFVLGRSGEIPPINVINPIAFTTVGSATFSYTVVANNTSLSDTLEIDGGIATLTVTCTPSNSDSQNLRALQLGITRTVAANSGAAITGAVDGAISNAFSSTAGGPITVTPNGLAMNFAAEAQSNVIRRTDEAFSALGYASDGYIKAPPHVYDPSWNAWADARGTGFDQNDALSDTHGTQLNVTGGLGHKITPDFVAGLFTGYERFNFTVEALAGKMSGDGGTVGAYAGYRFDPHWRADGMIGWSEIWYSALAGTALGSFTGSRWLGSGGLTGEYRLAGLTFEPSTRIYMLQEEENAWTDSLGTTQASRNFSEGRFSTGGKVMYPWQAAGIQVSPYIGSYADYRFSTDDALPVGVPFVGIKDGWSARATTGVTLATGRYGPSLSVGGELGGIGAGYDIWSASARVNWPF
jgi:hypothetical protein